MLGYAGMPWHSVTIAELPPRPAVEILSGGYRKIPVAQIGADIYCDTKTITTEIARLAKKPELALENCSPDIQDFVRHAELEAFLALSMTAGSGMMLQLVKDLPPTTVLRFLKDRAGIARTAKMKPVLPWQAKSICRDYIANMESLLSDDFLFGDAPCIADFAAYHGLWFACDYSGQSWVKKSAKVSAWVARMQAFGNGSPTSMTTEQALDLARDSTPADVTNPTADQNQSLRIAPSDYARDPVEGLLVGETDNSWVLKREHPRVNSVHVHFPKAGFTLKSL